MNKNKTWDGKVRLVLYMNDIGDIADAYYCRMKYLTIDEHGICILRCSMDDI